MAEPGRGRPRLFGEEGRQRRVAAALPQQDAGRVAKDVVVVGVRRGRRRRRTGVGHQDSKWFTHARDDGAAQRLRIRAGGSLGDAYTKFRGRGLPLGPAARVAPGAGNLPTGWSALHSARARLAPRLKTNSARRSRAAPLNGRRLP